MDQGRPILSTENSLLDQPRLPPPCSSSMKQVRFSGPTLSGDLELSVLESPRPPLSYHTLELHTTLPKTPSVSSSCQTECSKIVLIDRGCQTDLDVSLDVALGKQNLPAGNQIQTPVVLGEVVNMIQKQDRRMDSLHEKLELILSRFDERPPCSCTASQSETCETGPPIQTSPPALDNVLGQVELMLNSPRPPPVHDTSTSFRVDQSAAFDALAMKYLRGEELGRISNPPRDTDVSLATTAYLQRHRLPH